ncbi:MAG TPA: glycosyltransferase family 4 protein [Candidatus Saccharimonadales bacterium]|nr:glycosyltransferase family 4 protein [Candidatus Saccharimonadales bacterium]
MKIAQIVCAYPPYAGGIGNSAYRFHELLGVKHEITNFTPDTLRPVLRRGHGAFLPQLLWKLRKFDYIYLHYPFFGTAEIVWLFKIFFKKPKLIIHYHMDVKNQSLVAKMLSIPSQLIRNSLFKQAEIIVSASLDYVKHSQIKKFYEVHPEKFQEIPFGINLEKFQPNPVGQPSANNLIAKVKNIVRHINDLFIKKDRLDLIFIGGLDKAHYFKGVNILLNSLPSLDQRKWNLKIVGDGDLRSEYETLAARLNLSKRVEFTGKLSDSELIKALQNSDLLILPSINNNEAFGLVLIEALACGVPVIASDLPGVRSVFENKREGLLVIPNSIEDLNRKLEFILKNETQRQEMAKAARRLALRKYDQEAMKQKYENLFAKQSL